MKFLTECIVCTGTTFTTRMESNFEGSPLDAAQYFLANRRAVVHGRIQRCNTCGFVFTNPQFTSDEYDEIYKNVPAPTDTNITLDEGDTQRFARLAKNVRDDVGKTGRFLDFGCGGGGFLLAMNDPAGVGFEVGAPAVFHIGPSQVTTGRFFDLIGTPGFELESFDTITSFYVFEHLADLPRYVDTLKSLLRPGGHMVIGIPNVNSLNARLAGNRWNNYLLEHLWYFNKKTMKAFMQRKGFTMTNHRYPPYDAPIAHIVRRVAQTYGMKPPTLGPTLSRLIIPVPIGLIYGAFRRDK